jgi:hypothetical protein
MGSKGGTTTLSALWSIDSIDSSEGVDLLIWDYSMNDFASMALHRYFVNGFFEKALQKFENISSFAVVYWNDMTDGNLLFISRR